MTPFSVQLCGKVVKMADMSSLGSVEFAGKLLDDVRWQLRWEGGRCFQGEARLQSRGCRTRVRCHTVFEGDWLRCCEEVGSRALLGRNPAAWVSLYGDAGVIHYGYDMTAPESEVCHADGGSVGAVWIPDFRPCKNGAVG